MKEENNILIESINIINDTIFPNLNKSQKLLLLSNLLLIECKDLLPPDLQKDSSKLLSSGRRLVYEQLLFKDNIGISMGIKAHQIIDFANRLNTNEG